MKITPIFEALETEQKEAYERFLSRIREFESKLPHPDTLRPTAEDRDQFGPPERPVKVECYHCSSRYMSSKIKWEYRLECRPHEDALGGPIRPMWWCKDAECDGAGFGFDIHPVEGRRR